MIGREPRDTVRWARNPRGVAARPGRIGPARLKITTARLISGAVREEGSGTVEITIGVQKVAREIIIETNASSDEVVTQVKDALDNGTVLELVDAKGRRILVPSASIGFVELGSEEQRKVGF